MTTIAEVRGAGPVITEGAAVTVAANQIRYDGDNMSQEAGMLYAEVSLAVPTTIEDITLTNVISPIMYVNAGSPRLNIYDGVSASGVTLPVVGAFTPMKWATLWGTAEDSKGVNVEGVYGPDSNYDGDFAYNVPLDILGGRTSVQRIRNIRRYDLPYAEAKAKIDELML